MSDPAIEAAQRSWVKPRGRWALEHFNPDNRLEKCLADAAREAINPVRKLHRQGDGMCIGLCKGCLEEWPCQTARLIYTAEELS